MIFLLDNYDSFTYNLYQQLRQLGEDVLVMRNDAFSLEDIRAVNPSAIVVSPGPGAPSGAGMTEAVIGEFKGVFPIMGVCLGHQAVAEVFGGRIVKAMRLMHGKCAEVFHDGKEIFRGIPSPFTATRYHSLIVERESIPRCLRVTAWSAEGEVMGLSHRESPVFGVQFHPESVMTLEGKQIMSNFLRMRNGYQAGDSRNG